MGPPHRPRNCGSTQRNKAEKIGRWGHVAWTDENRVLRASKDGRPGGRRQRQVDGRRSELPRKDGYPIPEEMGAGPEDIV